jgi:hypothetical protein
MPLMVSVSVPSSSFGPLVAIRRERSVAVISRVVSCSSTNLAVGQVDVEERDVVLGVRQLLGRLTAHARNVDRVALSDQSDLQSARQARFVFHDQDPHPSKLAGRSKGSVLLFRSAFFLVSRGFLRPLVK